MLLETFNKTLKAKADGNGVYKRFKLVEFNHTEKIKFTLKLQALAVDSPNLKEIRHNVFENEKQLVTYLDGIETGLSL